jgi:hypothetical protein
MIETEINTEQRKQYPTEFGDTFSNIPDKRSVLLVIDV